VQRPHARPEHETLEQRVEACHFQSSAALPIVVGGEAWGAISVFSDCPDFFGEKETGLLEETAGDIGLPWTTWGARSSGIKLK